MLSYFHRRHFLQALAVTMVVSVPKKTEASGNYVVRYFDWSRDIETVLDQMGMVTDALPQEDAQRVELMRSNSGEYGIIGRYKSTNKAAEDIANRHDILIAQESDTTSANTTVIPSSSVERVFNVSYGLGRNLQELKEHYAILVTMLGPDVAKKLQIEQTSTGKYALVYKRYGDLESTEKVAKHHAKLLRSKGVEAAAIQEKNNTLVFDGTTVQGPINARPEPPKQQAESTTITRPIRAEPEVSKETETETETETRTVPLPNTKNSGLNSEIERYVKALRERGVVSSAEKTSWMVFDLTNNTTIASINKDVSRQAASMIKPFIMLAFFHRVQSGRIIYGKQSKAKLSAMIQRSSNSATNWTIDQLGGPAKVQAILAKYFGEIFQDTNIVEKIGKGGRTYKNRASASDYVRYLHALWKEDLPHNAEQMRLLNLPGRDRIYNGVPSIPIGTAIYNKTGSTSKLCGDMGIVVAKTSKGTDLAYAFVGIIERESRVGNYGRWISKQGTVIRGVSDLTYSHLKKMYNLR
jgi:beta-lactamase class A